MAAKDEPAAEAAPESESEDNKAKRHRVTHKKSAKVDDDED
jgi:hypothetical protein